MFVRRFRATQSQGTQTMSRSTLVQAGACAAGILFGAVHSARAQSSAPASFIVVHGIPGRDVAAGLDPALPVDVLVAGKYCLLQGLTFRSIRGPYDVPPGTYSVAISLANPIAPCSNAAVISANVTLTSGEFGAIVAALSTSGAPAAEVYPIDVAPVGVGKQRFVTIHAADAPAVHVKVVSLGQDSEKVTFPLFPGKENVSVVPARKTFLLQADAGGPVIGPVTVTPGNQGVTVTVAVGSATTGSAELLTKVIPDVF
jgi:hypothetical protein